MSDLHLTIVTPEGVAFKGPVTSVMAPGLYGNFTVLRGHTPMVAALERGVARVVDATGERHIVVDGGVFEVRANDAMILSRWAQAAENAAQTADIIKARREQVAALTAAKPGSAPKPASAAAAH